jgi:AcrR family transcriptional regulator
MDGITAAAEDHPGQGLRARKRAAARAAIERAAIALVLERGYERVTVDMICTAGMVSPRTFFNYFGSKEGVFLGPAPDDATEAVTRAFSADTGAPVVLALARAVFSALYEGQPDAELARARMKVVMDSPELLSKQNEWMAVHENQLADLVVSRYQREGRGEPAEDLAAEARMVVGLALGVVRVVLQESYLEDDGGWPGAGAMDRSGELLERIFPR